MKKAALFLILWLALACAGCADAASLAGEPVAAEETAAVDATAPEDTDILPAPAAAAGQLPATTNVAEGRGDTADGAAADLPTGSAIPAAEQATKPAAEPLTAAEAAELTCSLSIRCDTILDNPDKLAVGKEELVPADGLILYVAQAVFSQGESAFDVLQRETRSAGVHLEFVNTPAYKTAYIEGIGNLYEHDCGELSGWLYQVNGAFPGFGCSQYELSDGDEIAFVYSCDLGRDVGSTVGNQ